MDRDFELGQQIAELKGIVESGFKDVTRRQDIANGRTAKTEIRIEALEKKDDFNDGLRRGIRVSWGFVVTVVTLITGFIAALAYFR